MVHDSWSDNLKVDEKDKAPESHHEFGVRLET